MKYYKLGYVRMYTGKPNLEIFDKLENVVKRGLEIIQNLIVPFDVDGIGLVVMKLGVGRGKIIGKITKNKEGVIKYEGWNK